LAVTKSRSSMQAAGQYAMLSEGWAQKSDKTTNPWRAMATATTTYSNAKTQNKGLVNMYPGPNKALLINIVAF
jgi:hypothetical protein